MTGKKPGIVLIRKKAGDERYMRRLRAIIKNYGLPVDVWWVGE
jgi:hypothetical protein